MGADNAFARFIPFAALLVVGIVLWQGRTVGSKLGAVALGLILGGAVGNLVDRAFRAGDGGFFSGAVVDFIDPQWFPIFNVADSGVVIGGFLLVFVSLRAPADDGPAPADPAGDEADTGPAGSVGPDPR
jgi:signal peptidase II